MCGGVCGGGCGCGCNCGCDGGPVAAALAPVLLLLLLERPFIAAASGAPPVRGAGGTWCFWALSGAALCENACDWLNPLRLLSARRLRSASVLASNLEAGALAAILGVASAACLWASGRPLSATDGGAARPRRKREEEALLPVPVARRADAAAPAGGGAPSSNG